MKHLLPLLSLAAAARALYFFADAAQSKCFYEELPKDTLVVGHFTAEEYDERSNAWQQHTGLTVYISVEEVFDHNHRIVAQQGGSSGRFTFTAHESGEHRICFVPSSTSGRQEIFTAGALHGGIKMKLDLELGESGVIESSDKDKLESLTSRLEMLNARLGDIRREQIFQTEREADFRDQSESTNARVVRWIIYQLIVIGVTCAWQLSHLRNFFIKQKLT
ncbi:hypothetical protein E4U42_000980 [Claviceps africana]|uniref:GOLD domain-containing protein n=1 Tax=Claviceps africana TaxID=83212 RepID=A0A8K0JA90_9HYPO|nr:hypothetical protein E4U42_000980 [Claviceps africana]